MANRLVSIGAVCAAFALPALASPTTGNDYRAMNDSMRAVWVDGALDGVLVGHLRATGQSSPLAECVSSITPKDRRVIFDKELAKAPPGVLQFPAALSVNEVFKMHCGLESR